MTLGRQELKRWRWSRGPEPRAWSPDMAQAPTWDRPGALRTPGGWDHRHGRGRPRGAGPQPKRRTLLFTTQTASSKRKRGRRPRHPGPRAPCLGGRTIRPVLRAGCKEGGGAEQRRGASLGDSGAVVGGGRDRSGRVKAPKGVWRPACQAWGWRREGGAGPRAA